MRVQLAVALVAALCCELSTCSYQRYKTYRLRPTMSQMAVLKTFENVEGFDIWTRSRAANATLDIMVSPGKQQAFQAFLGSNGIAHMVLVDDVQAAIDEENKRQRATLRSATGSISFQRYNTHPEINAYLDEMAARYPRLAKVVTIGKSTEGRDLKVIKISRARNNPVIWIDAGIHAREWIAPAMALYVINQLLEVPANSALLDGVDWHILPVVNPDGYQWSHTNDRMWRKTRSMTPSPNCIGVDGNRNWDLQWSGPGSSGNPCTETYYGPKPFSEPETAAIRDYLLDNAPHIGLYLTIHSYGSYILYPWGWTHQLPANWEELDDLARKANAAQVSAGGQPFEIGSSTNLLSEGAGGSDDWALGVAEIPFTYTIEMPGGGANGFDLPASQIQKTVRQFFAAFVAFGDHVRGAIDF